jgi:hypothetical protein
MVGGGSLNTPSFHVGDSNRSKRIQNSEVMIRSNMVVTEDGKEGKV